MFVRLLILIMTAWAVPAVCDDSRAEKRLRAVRRASRSSTYVPPSARELAVAEKLFRCVLSGAPLDSCAAQAEQLGMSFESLEHDGETLLIISQESGGVARGWGCFAFRLSPDAPEVLLQAPHSRADRFTGRIAQRLFLSGGARGVAFNGASRHAPRRAAAADGEDDDDGGRRRESDPADVAHSEASLFQALTRAYADVHPDGLVVQVHGFSQEKRSSAAGRSADIVVSDGSGSVPAWIRSLERRLEDSIAVNVGLYPDEVRELGGTTNRQGILLRASKGARFLHLELSLPFRQRLLRESDLPGRLERCWLD